MKAPTNVYGPEGDLVKKGADIPDEWFEILPDLRDHLADVERTLGSTSTAIAEPDRPTRPRPSRPKKTVPAKATLSRERGSR